MTDVADMIAGSSCSFITDYWATRETVAREIRDSLKATLAKANILASLRDEDADTWQNLSDCLADQISDLDHLIGQISAGLGRAETLTDYGTESPSPEDVYGVPQQGAIR